MTKYFVRFNRKNFESPVQISKEEYHMYRMCGGHLCIDMIWGKGNVLRIWGNVETAGITAFWVDGKIDTHINNWDDKKRCLLPADEVLKRAKKHGMPI